ncbi:MAG: sulfatase, partial [Bacteroidota bacterium]
AGLSQAIPKMVQGKDFSALVTNPDADQIEPEAALVMGYKYRGVYTGKYTFVVEEKQEKIQSIFCYDNEKDPYQLTKLSQADMGEDLENKLKTKLVDLLIETEDVWVDKKVGANYLVYQ